jgi:spore maturation protein CgeB
MVAWGYSPSVRLFEAAACGATMISDNWPGLDTFFCPGREILLPTSTTDVCDLLDSMDESAVRQIGDAAQARVLQSHTSACRAIEFENALSSASRLVSSGDPAVETPELIRASL